MEDMDNQKSNMRKMILGGLGRRSGHIDICPLSGLCNELVVPRPIFPQFGRADRLSAGALGADWQAASLRGCWLKSRPKKLAG